MILLKVTYHSYMILFYGKVTIFFFFFKSIDLACTQISSSYGIRLHLLIHFSICSHLINLGTLRMFSKYGTNSMVLKWQEIISNNDSSDSVRTQNCPTFRENGFLLIYIHWVTIRHFVFIKINIFSLVYYIVLYRQPEYAMVDIIRHISFYYHSAYKRKSLGDNSLFPKVWKHGWEVINESLRSRFEVVMVLFCGNDLDLYTFGNLHYWTVNLMVWQVKYLIHNLINKD